MREQYPAMPAAEPRSGADPSPANLARRAAFVERNRALQAATPKPPDGVTFGSGRKRGEKKAES